MSSRQRRLRQDEYEAGIDALYTRGWAPRRMTPEELDLADRAFRETQVNQRFHEMYARERDRRNRPAELAAQKKEDERRAAHLAWYRAKWGISDPEKS